MSLQDLKAMSKDQLIVRLIQLRKASLNLRFKKAESQSESVTDIRNTRKEIAQCKTLLKQLDQTTV